MSPQRSVPRATAIAAAERGDEDAEHSRQISQPAVFPSGVP